MGIVLDTKNNKLYGVEVDDEPNDLLNGSIVPYASLTTPPGFPTSVKAYQGPGGWVDKFQNEDFVYARDTGRLWQLQVDNTNAQALVLIAEGSAQPSGGAQGPDIVYVTAQPAQYPGMSTAVYTTLPAAVAAGGALTGERTIVLLDDTYDLGATALAVPNLINLIGLSRTGVTITSADVAGTLLTGGNHLFKGITVRNTGGSKAIVPTAGGTLTFDGCSQIEDVDASINNTSTTVVMLNKSLLDDFVGGTAQCALENYSNSIVGNVNLPTAGSSVLSVGSPIINCDVNGSLYTEQGEISNVGVQVPPTDYTALGTLFSNSTTIIAQVLRLQDVRGDSTAAISSTVGSIVCDGCTFGTGTTMVSNTNIEFSGGRAPQLSAPNGRIICNSSESAASISGADLEFAFFKCTDGGATWTGTTSVLLNACVSNGQVLTSAAGSIRSVDTELTAPITLAAGASFTAERGSVHVATAGAGNGAIVNNGGIVTLIDTYVRADDTFYSVSGTGTVNTHGYIGGGCRFNTSGGLTVGTTTSDVRGNAIFNANPINANTTLDALSGATNEVFDMFLLSGITAPGFVINIYAARDFPQGFELVVKNVDVTNSVDIAPAPSGSIDGSSTPITLAPNDFRRMRKISLTGWTTC